MKLRSRKKTIATSLAVVVTTGILATIVAGVIPTDKVNEKKTKTENNTVRETVSVEVLDHEMVMGTAGIASTADVNEQEVAEAETEEVQTQPEIDPEYANKFMTNVDDTLNIRSAADENSDVVGKLNADSGGDVLENGADWTKVKSGNVEGYVATQYLVFGNDAKARAEEVGAKNATVIEDNIRVRTTPSEDAGIIGLADINDVYSVTNQSADWAEIDYDGQVGYVSKQYLNIVIEVGTAISSEEEQEQIRLEEEERQAQLKAEQEAAEAAEKEKAAKEKKAKEEAEEKQEESVKAESKSKNVETVQTDSFDASTDDSYLLACLVEAEAGSEPYEGKLAVANVVLNRVSSYGSIYSVIYAPGQFSVVKNGRLDRIKSSGPSSQSVEAANAALSGTNNVPNYNFFRATYAADFSRYNNYTIIGTQVFYN